MCRPYYRIVMLFGTLSLDFLERDTPGFLGFFVGISDQLAQSSSTSARGEGSSGSQIPPPFFLPLKGGLIRVAIVDGASDLHHAPPGCEIPSRHFEALLVHRISRHHTFSLPSSISSTTKLPVGKPIPVKLLLVKFGLL
ncbi:hypothetical protein Taro_044757 [Colocasia esculenta]|uniref:Uncharacterized protein n=1 Tax=Colocasia esculenta TaxID=4460 RepID=A0A843WUU4_COLES|nr:hypothetical protein [Colocasia esculenta]